MKHLPTEIVLQIMGHLSKADLMSVALVAFKYSTLARPFLFRRIQILSESSELPDWISQIAESDNALMIKVIEIGSHWNKSCLEGVRNLFQAAVTLEELSILPSHETIQLELFDPAIVPNLRKFAITSHTDYTRLVVDFLPHLPKLIDLEVPHLGEQWAMQSRFTSVIWQHGPSFMDRLDKFRGPPYFLQCMSKTGRALQHFSATKEITDRGLSFISKELGFREELLSLHIVIPVGYDNWSFSWVERQCIPPSLVPSLFPNLRSVAWFRVHHLLPERKPVSVVTAVH